MPELVADRSVSHARLISFVTANQSIRSASFVTTNQSIRSAFSLCITTNQSIRSAFSLSRVGVARLAR